MLGIGTRKPAQEVGPQEKDISSLLLKTGETKSYTVEEEISLMGSITPEFSNGKQIVIFKPGDEITVLSFTTPKRYTTSREIAKGQGDIEKLLILHVSKSGGQGGAHFFIRSEVGSRKIKISPN